MPELPTSASYDGLACSESLARVAPGVVSPSRRAGALSWQVPFRRGRDGETRRQAWPAV